MTEGNLMLRVSFKRYSTIHQKLSSGENSPASETAAHAAAAAICKQKRKRNSRVANSKCKNWSPRPPSSIAPPRFWPATPLISRRFWPRRCKRRRPPFRRVPGAGQALREKIAKVLHEVVNGKPAAGANDGAIEELCIRQAHAAVTLARMRELQPAWTMLKQTPDPTSAELPHSRNGRAGVDPLVLMQRI